MKENITNIIRNIFDREAFDDAMAIALIERINYDELAEIVLDMFTSDELLEIVLSVY